MPKTIWKFSVGPDSYIVMPDGARILTIQVQGTQPCLWAEVDPEHPTTSRHFTTYGTGHTLPDDPGTYIGTFQLPNLGLVFHTYEVKP